MQSHKVRAKTLGAEVVKAERAVEALFRSADVDSARLRAAVQYAARAEANYGVSHLETHVRMRALLSDDQVARYVTLRGYEGGHGAADHRH